MDINRDLYEKQKLKVTARVSRIMDAYAFPAFDEMDPISVAFMKRLYNGRRNRSLKGGRLRDMAIRMALNICGVKNLNANHLKIIAAGEFYNMASYYQNWHLDAKKEVKDEEERKLCHISSHFFRELAEQTIMEASFNNQVKLSLLKEISESNKAVQIGQSLESNSLNHETSIMMDEPRLYEMYLKRCRLITGRFYGCSFAMAPIISEKDDRTIESFRSIGSKLGVAMQIINDVGDFCLNENISKTPDKDYQDQFSDLEKGTLTLPIYELSKILQVRKYVRWRLNEKEKRKVLHIMVKNRCFDSSRGLTNYLANILLQDVCKLGKGHSTNMLKFMINLICHSNKFYVNLREEHGYRWGEQQPLSDSQRNLIRKLI